MSSDMGPPLEEGKGGRKKKKERENTNLSFGSE